MGTMPSGIYKTHTVSYFGKAYKRSDPAGNSSNVGGLYVVHQTKVGSRNEWHFLREHLWAGPSVSSDGESWQDKT